MEVVSPLVAQAFQRHPIVVDLILTLILVPHMYIVDAENTEKQAHFSHIYIYDLLTHL